MTTKESSVVVFSKGRHTCWVGVVVVVGWGLSLLLAS